MIINIMLVHFDIKATPGTSSNKSPQYSDLGLTFFGWRCHGKFPDSNSFFWKMLNPSALGYDCL
jgi:hypothetical protein